MDNSNMTQLVLGQLGNWLFPFVCYGYILDPPNASHSNDD